MKKVVKLILIFILILFIFQIHVNADMGIPGIKPYDAKVINPNGVTCYDSNGNELVSLKYGDEIKVQYEYIWGDSSVATFYHRIDGKSQSVDIDLKDIASSKEMYVSEELNINNPIDKVVVDEYGATLYKGPGYAYAKTDTVIPKGTEIVVYMEGEEYNDNPWFYTTYEGVSGWVCELQTLGSYVEGDVILSEETEFMERTVGDVIPEQISTIPDKKILKNIILLDPWEQSYYLEYEGKWGTISNRNEIFKSDYISIYKVPEEVKIYDKLVRAEVENEVIGTIPANTEFAVLYGDYHGISLYVKYNGIEGWIADLNYRSKAEKVETTNLELPSFDEFTVIESPKLLVEEVKIKENENKKEEEQNKVENVLKNEVVENIVEVENITETDNEVEKEENESVETVNATPEQIVMFGIVAAIVISLTCIVTIILINKTSKKENK